MVGCVVVKSDSTYSGAQGFDYFEGISAQSAGSTGMPHLPYNPSADEPCTAVLARTDPNEQESVVLLD
jgi:uncharacterized RmlC-like cupin family protein